jgi:arsenite-transporting ATPase
MTIDVAQRQVKLFLPGFAKNQVQLTQYGPELTIAAGDQRRNLLLPQALMGQKVTGAKFQDGYLTISF